MRLLLLWVTVLKSDVAVPLFRDWYLAVVVPNRVMVLTLDLRVRCSILLVPLLTATGCSCRMPGRLLNTKTCRTRLLVLCTLLTDRLQNIPFSPVNF